MGQKAKYETALTKSTHSEDNGDVSGLELFVNKEHPILPAN